MYPLDGAKVSARTSTDGLADDTFGRCPRCGFIVEEAFDYDSGGNEIFRCDQDGQVFAQDKAGAYVLHLDGEPLARSARGDPPVH